MNPKDYLQTILKVKAGSHLYNLATETSDEDIRGCVVCTHPHFLFGFKKFEQMESKDPDLVLWNLQKFINMALDGNTVALECIWAPDDKIIESSSFGKFLRSNRDKFLSKRIFKVLQGYGFAEYRRALGETTGRLGDKRKKEIEQFGYSPKNASHCLRLLLVGYYIFKNHEYKTSWNGHTRNFLMSFKQGKQSLSIFKATFSDFMWKMEKAFEKTSLPENPDSDFIITSTVDFLRTLL
jgi:predicted nucleotidyltransferase